MNVTQQPASLHFPTYSDGSQSTHRHLPQEMRLAALGLALEHHRVIDATVDAAVVVDTAQVFTTFLAGSL